VEIYLKHSLRLDVLPPYLFAELDRKKQKVASTGREVLDLGVGDPDMPTPKPIVEEMRKAVRDPATHRYPSYRGSIEFRSAATDWLKKRFDIEIDPQNEVNAVIGTKEGLFHLALAIADPGDYVITPDPAYPVYANAARFAQATPYPLPLSPPDFLPDLDSIPEEVLEQASLMYINYPNNPTSAVAHEQFFEKVVRLARKHRIAVCHDAAYSEIYFEEPQPSLLEVEGAKEVAIEMHSLSKTFNMTGWRIGFACGNETLVQALAATKTNLDSGVFSAIQRAGIKALSMYDELSEPVRATYRKRRDIMTSALNEAGFNIKSPKATFYLWFEVPERFDGNSKEFASHLLDTTGVVLTPGVGFGKFGEGFCRISLTAPDEVIKKAADVLAAHKA